MRARLFARHGPLAGQDVEFRELATVGRAKSSTLRVSDKHISRNHLRIRFDPGERCYVLEDLGSAQGTEVDGAPVSGARRLSRLNVITLAHHFELIFQDLEACAERAAKARGDAPAPSSPPPPAAARAEAAPTSFALEILNLEGGARRFDLEPGANRVCLNLGSAPTGIDITVEGGRATAHRIEDGPEIEMDGRPLPDGEALRPGADLRFGPVRARLVERTG